MGGTKQKKLYIEWLRIIAILLVIYNHTRAWGFSLYQVTEEAGSKWLSVAMVPLCKIAVPVFMMIAGTNLLKRQESLKELFQKRISRYIIVIVLCGTVQFLRYVRAGKSVFSVGNWIRAVVAEPAIEPYWFLYLYLGFLLILPFLRKMAERLEKQEFVYLFVLMAVYNILTAVGCFSGIMVNGNVFALVAVNVFFYPLIGYGIDKYSDGGDWKKYSLLSVGTLAAALVTGIVYSRMHPEETTVFAGLLQNFTPLLACGIFGLFKTLCRQKENGVAKVLTALGGATFGIYLTEDIIRNQVEKILVKTQMADYMNDFFVAVIFTVLTFGIGVCIIYPIKKLPVIRRLL